jgi:hypothetical protein
MDYRYYHKLYLLTRKLPAAGEAIGNSRFMRRHPSSSIGCCRKLPAMFLLDERRRSPRTCAQPPHAQAVFDRGPRRAAALR